MLVWAFQKLDELNNQTGFVNCDDKVGDKLLKSGAVQDPRVGAMALKSIETTKVVEAAPVKKVVTATKKATTEKKILNEREEIILKSLLGGYKTTAIGKEMNVTNERVYQILRSAIKKVTNFKEQT